MSPPTKNTYWLGVITTFCLFSTSYYFASPCLELSFLSPRIAFGNFSDYSPLVLICISVSFSRVLLRFCFFCNSLFLLSFHFFFLDIRSIFGGFGLGSNDFLVFFFCLFSWKLHIFQHCSNVNFSPWISTHVTFLFTIIKVIKKKQKKKTRKPLPSRVNSPWK